MNKAITLCLLQAAQTVFSIGLWTAAAIIWHAIQYKTLKEFRKHMGVKRPPKGAILRSGKHVGIAYLFTVAMYITLKLANGGMSASILNEERTTLPLPLLLVTILLAGIRSGFGEELFFRGAVSTWLHGKLGSVKGNLLQALIFTLPHIFTFAHSPGLESVLLLANAFVIGIALGYITHKESGSTVPAMFWHAIINIVAVPITWFIM